MNIHNCQSTTHCFISNNPMKAIRTKGLICASTFSNITSDLAKIIANKHYDRDQKMDLIQRYFSKLQTECLNVRKSDITFSDTDLKNITEINIHLTHASDSSIKNKTLTITFGEKATVLMDGHLLNIDKEFTQANIKKELAAIDLAKIPGQRQSLLQRDQKIPQNIKQAVAVTASEINTNSVNGSSLPPVSIQKLAINSQESSNNEIELRRKKARDFLNAQGGLLSLLNYW